MTMKDKPNDILLLAGKILTILMQGVSALAGVFLLILMPVIFIFQDKITSELTANEVDYTGVVPVFVILGLFALLIMLLAGAFVFFGKLRAIIATVGEGDPFAPENADRLSVMAWLLLAIQVVMIPAGGLGLLLAKWADEVGNSDVTIDAGLDLTGILMVIVLFILARVFKHGAAMREDLEGTV